MQIITHKTNQTQAKWTYFQLLYALHFSVLLKFNKFEFLNCQYANTVAAWPRWLHKYQRGQHWAWFEKELCEETFRHCWLRRKRQCKHPKQSIRRQLWTKKLRKVVIGSFLREFIKSLICNAFCKLWWSSVLAFIWEIKLEPYDLHQGHQYIPVWSTSFEFGICFEFQ